MKIHILDAKTLGDDIDLSVITGLGESVIYPATLPEERVKNIGDAEVLVLNKTILDEEVLEEAKNLKLICVAATGYDNIDVEYCREHGIAVCNVVGYSSASVAQLTVSLVLNLMLHMRGFTDFVRSGEYTKSGIQNRLSPTFHELDGLTWGIAGYGNIGKRVAAAARALGCRVIAYKKTPEEGVECVDLKRLCAESDIITIHLPLSEETRGLFGEEEISLMKKTAVIVNTARGAVTDEAAFAEAILHGKIGGFGTDVYSLEPIAEDSPLWKVMEHPNTIFTPHMAWGAYEARMRCMREIAENIKVFFAGGVRNRVDL